MNFLGKRCPGVNCYLDNELLTAASGKGTMEFRAVETLLRGKEIKLPGGQQFLDKDENPRHAIRVRWWDGEARNFRRAFLGQKAARSHIPEDPIDVDHLINYGSEKPPVFVGHYRMYTEPDLLAPNMAWLDYSVAKPEGGGKLVAFRWNGEPQLNKVNFVCVVRAPCRLALEIEPVPAPINRDGLSRRNDRGR